MVTLEISLFSLGTLLFSPVFGVIGERIKLSLTVVLLFILGLLFNVGILLSGSVLLVLFWRFMSGMTATKEAMLTSMLTIAVPDSERTRSLAWITTGKSMGLALGPILGAYVASWYVSLPDQLNAVIVAAILLGLMSAALVSMMGRVGKADAQYDRKASSGSLLAIMDTLKRAVRRMPEVMALRTSMGFANAVVLVVTVLYVKDRFGWGVVESGYMFGSMVVLLAVARVVVLPILVKKIGSYMTTLISGYALSGCLLLFAIQPDQPMFIGIFAMISLCNGILPASLLVLIADKTTDDERTLVLSVGTSFFSIGQLIAGFVSGIWLYWLGISAPYITSSLVMLCALFFATSRWAARSA